jgi:chromate reductase
VGATTGSFGAIWAQTELRKVLATTGAKVLEDGVSIPRAHERIGPDDEIVGDGLLAELDRVIAALVRKVELSTSPKS